MTRQLECDVCGAAVTDGDKHRRYHDDIAAWIHLIELEVEARIRTERRHRDGL